MEKWGRSQRLADVLQSIAAETLDAQEKHAPMNSHHEAYAVMKEEMEEYWSEVKKKPEERDCRAMATELVQLGAMVVRTLTEICYEEICPDILADGPDGANNDTSKDPEGPPRRLFAPRRDN